MTRSPPARPQVDVPRAHAVAAESALDARLLERAEHHAVELADAADGDRFGRRAERGHDAGEKAIALLPVGAGHVERDRRSLAVGGRAFERHVSVVGVNVALVEANRFGIEPIADVTGDRNRRQRRVIAERSFDQVAIARILRGVGRQLRALKTGDRGNDEVPSRRAPRYLPSGQDISLWPVARPARRSPCVPKKSVSALRSTS